MIVPAVVILTSCLVEEVDYLWYDMYREKAIQDCVASYVYPVGTYRLVPASMPDRYSIEVLRDGNLAYRDSLQELSRINRYDVRYPSRANLWRWPKWDEQECGELSGTKKLRDLAKAEAQEKIGLLRECDKKRRQTARKKNEWIDNLPEPEYFE